MDLNDYDKLTIDGERIKQIARNGEQLWHETNVRTASGNSPVSFVGNRNRGLKKFELFGKCEQKSPLPDDFQAVEYVGGSGAQYINTGYTVKENSEFYCDFSADYTSPAGDNALYGCYIDPNKKVKLEWYGVTAFFAFGSVQKAGTPSQYISANTRYVSVLNKSDGLTLRGVTTSNNYFFGVNAIPMYLFARNNNGSPDYLCHGKIYQFRIYESGILVHDFVPCYRKSDVEIGMYDVVGGVFYTNLGGGSFTKGADAQPSSDDPWPIFSNNAKWIVNGDTVDLSELRLNGIGSYQDTYDVVTGTVTRKIGHILSYNGETVTTPYLSTTGGLDLGAEVFYQLPTPTEEQVAPQQLNQQIGSNTAEWISGSVDEKTALVTYWGD